MCRTDQHNTGPNMIVSFELSDAVQRPLQVAFGDLGEAAKRSLLEVAYARGEISIGRFAEALGMGVIEAQRWLADHNIPLNYSIEDYQADRETLADLLGNQG